MKDMKELFWCCLQETDKNGTPLYDGWDDGSFDKAEAVRKGKELYNHFDLLTISGWAESEEDALENDMQDTLCVNTEHFDKE